MAQQNSSGEVDLGYIFRKSNDFFKSIIRGLFLIFEFFRKFIIILIVLSIIGFGYGYYRDLNDDVSYTNEVIVIPNFESVDYLYDKAEAINNKIAAKDTVYLKEVVDTNFLKLEGIKLEPIVDIFNFVSKSGRNFEVLKLISEKQDVSKYMEDPSISKYYKYHRMEVSVSGDESSEKMITDLLTFLNKNEHFEEYQKIYIENNTLQIQEHYNMISQIDSVLKATSRINATASNVSISNSADLFDLIDRKRQLLAALLQLKTEEIDFKAPIKKVSVDYNLKAKKLLPISNKIKYPLILIGLFSLIFYFRFVLRKWRRIVESDS